MTLAGGVYTRVRNWVADANGSIAIEATLHDTEDDSIAAALNLAIYRDGQAAYTANQPMGGFKLTNLANGSADADSISLGQANGLYLLKAQLAAGLPVNASITSSVAANALTIALKTGAGADASSASPILLPFRSATATDGAITVRSVTAANSLVISSGSTLATIASKAFRIWVVAFDDAGTVRLGAINCVIAGGVTDPTGNNAIPSVFPLRNFAMPSSLAEGGAGGADSSAIFYTGTAVSSKPFCVLGYLDCSGGQATPGTWATDADIKQAYGPGIPLPGDVVQRKIGGAAGSTISGTTVLPIDASVPQNTEGVQTHTLAFAAQNACNIVSHQILIPGVQSSNTDSRVAAALFSGSTADAIAATLAARDAAANAFATIVLRHSHIANSVSSISYAVRFGTSSAGTTTYAGTTFTNISPAYAVMPITHIIEEIMV